MSTGLTVSWVFQGFKWSLKGFKARVQNPCFEALQTPKESLDFQRLGFKVGESFGIGFRFRVCRGPCSESFLTYLKWNLNLCVAPDHSTLASALSHLSAVHCLRCLQAVYACLCLMPNPNPQPSSVNPHLSTPHRLEYLITKPPNHIPLTPKPDIGVRIPSNSIPLQRTPASTI